MIHKKRKKIYRVHLKKDPEDGFVVTVPALPGCVTWGKTQEHALEMAQEAIEGFLKALAKEGEDLPNDRSILGLREALIQVASPAVK